MNANDLLNAIGDVDDILIKTAKENQRPRTAVWTTIGSLAACVLLLFILPLSPFISRGEKHINTENDQAATDRHDTGANTANDTALELLCTRIDISTLQTQWNITDTDSIRAIQSEITDILSAYKDIEDSVVKDELSTEQNREVTNAIAPTLSDKPQKDGEIVIKFVMQHGAVRVFKLSASTLTDLADGIEYPLNDTQLDVIHQIIGHTE